MKTAVLVNDTSLNRHHGCHLVSRQIDRLAKEAGILIGARSAVGQDWRADQAFVTALKNADMVLVNGEGTLHSSKPYALPVVQVAEYAGSLSKPAFLINSIWQGNDERFIDAARHFSAIWVRESTSQSELAKAGIRAEVVPDLTLSSDPPVERARRGILFNDSNKPDVTARLFRRMRTQKNASWLSILTPPTSGASLSSQLMSWGAWIAFTTLFQTIRASAPTTRACNYTGAHAGLKGVLAAVAGSEGVVTGRFHAVCFSILTATPFLAIPSSSHKIEAMLRDAGLSERIYAAQDIDSANLDALMPFTEDQLAKVLAFRDHARTSARTMFQAIRATCG